MKVLMVMLSGILPYPTGICGVPVMTWAIVQRILASGHSLGICANAVPSRLDPFHAEARQRLQADGVQIYDVFTHANVPVPQSLLKRHLRQWRSAVVPRLEDFYSLTPVTDLQRTVDETQPDVILAYDLNAAVPVACLQRKPPTLADTVNLDHVAKRVKLETTPAKTLRERYHREMNYWKERKRAYFEVQSLKAFDSVVSHAAHHASWLREKGVSRVMYLPNPVVDAVGDTWEELRLRYQREREDNRLHVLFIGRLDSIINRPALELLAMVVLPHLEGLLGSDGFRLDIVGKGDIEPHVAEALNRPYVRRRGFVEDAAAEFLACDVVVVPTFSELGFRTRIAEAFSYGCCIVSHQANAKGMPELRHEENALLAASGHGLAEQIARAAGDSALRTRLSAAARKVYEDHLDAEVITAQIVEEMERLYHARIG